MHIYYAEIIAAMLIVEIWSFLIQECQWLRIRMLNHFPVFLLDFLSFQRYVFAA